MERVRPNRVLPPLLAVLGAAAALGATAYRLHLGLHFSDEPYYIAGPLRFVLGDRVFVDDLDVRQLSGLPLVPFLWLYTTAAGGSDGIVLFTRWLYLLYGLGVAGVVCYVLRGQMPGIAAGLIGLVCAVYAPFNIFNLSYNSMASGFLVVGIMLGVAGVVGARGRALHLLFSGAAHALAVMNYPTLVVVAAGFTGLLAWYLPGPRRRALLAFCLGAAAVALPVTGVLVHAGLDQLRAAIDFTVAWNTVYGSEVGGGASKLTLLRHQLPAIAPPLALTALVSVILLALARVRPAAGCVLAPLLVVPPLLYGDAENATSMVFVIVSGLLAPVFCWWLRERVFVRALFVLGWVPSFAAGVVCAWTSTNGLLNAAIGLLPACLITLAVIVLWTLEQAALGGSRLLRGVAMATPAAAIAGLVYCQYVGSTVFEDGQVVTEYPLFSFGFTVRDGPFRGIATRESTFTLLTQLSSDLPKLANAEGKILCYPNFPACYLMTAMRPASPNCWVGGDFGRHARWYAERESPHDVIVRLKPNIPGAFSGIELLDEAALRSRRLAIDRTGYAIYTGAP